MIDRSERLDGERFNLIVRREYKEDVILNSSPLTHKEAIIMKSKQSDYTKPFVMLVSLRFNKAP